MKKLTTQIIKNNKIKTIYAMVDDKTAQLLEKADATIRHEYIVAEHKNYLSELKETRRHQSLDQTLENGHEFVDEDSNIEDIVFEKEAYSELHKAISTLSKEQQWLINEIYFRGRSQVDIAKELGIKRNSLNDRLSRALNKLKKNLQ